MQCNDLRNEYDVVIVGGGMVGATLACALANKPATAELSVLIVDTQAMPAAGVVSNHMSFDSRSTALSAVSREILERVGLWEQVEDSACPIQKIHVSDQGRFGNTKIDHEDFSVPALGYVLENAAFGSALATKLRELPRCDFFAPARVVDATPIEEGMRIEIEQRAADSSGDVSATPQSVSLTTSLLVVAEGGRSPLCDQLGIARSKEDYGQHALIANVALSQPHEGIAYERFTSTGPLALLPLFPVDGEQRASLVWTLDANEVESYTNLDEGSLLERLQAQFGWRLGRLKRIGARAVYPLSLRVAQEQIRPNLLLLGNVAHAIHPVAGQGLNLSLRDIEALVDTLCDAMTNAGEGKNKVIGSMQTLSRYLQVREDDQSLTIGATDALTKLFSSNAQAKVWLRKAGLLSIDLIPALKRNFAARAMGFD